MVFEYVGSRRPLFVTRNGGLCNAIERELEKLGCIEPDVHLSALKPPSHQSFLLQRWSTTWNVFVDVESIDDVEDQDRLTVVRAPSQEVNIPCFLPYFANLCALGGGMGGIHKTRKKRFTEMS